MTTEFSIDDISAEVRRNWNVLQNADYNPIPVALELLQKNNPSRDPQSFTAIHDRLEIAMESIINKNYSAFNESIAMFGSIVEDIQSTRQVISKLKSDVITFRDQLEYRRNDIQGTMEKLAALRLDSEDKKEIKRKDADIKKVKELLEEDELEPAVKYFKFSNIEESSLRKMIIEKLYEQLIQLLFASDDIDNTKLALILALLVEMDAPFDESFKTDQAIRHYGMELISSHPLKPVGGQREEAVLDVHLKRHLKAELLSFGPALKNLCCLLVNSFTLILKAVESVPALSERLKADFDAELAYFVELCVRGRLKRGEFHLQVPNPVVVMTALLKNEPVNVSPCYQYQPFYDQEIQDELAQTETLKHIDLKKFLQEREDGNEYQLNLKPNPQYLVFIYKSFTLSGPILEKKLEDLCANDYYSVLENWLMEELKINFAIASDAFFRKKQSVPANIFVSFAEMLKKLILAKQAVPIAPLEKLFATLFDALSKKLDETVRDVFYFSGNGESKPIQAISSALSQSKTLRALYDLHPALSRIITASGSLEASLAEKEILHIEQVKRDRSLHKSEVIFDAKKLELLAAIQEGCEYLIRCFEGEDGYEIELFLQNDNILKCALSMRQPIEFVDFQDTNFITKYVNLKNGLQELAKSLLYSLRLELRVHCIYYLDLAYREGTYYGVNDKADSYVELSTSDIMQIRSLMERCLAYQKYLFVMDGLAASLSELSVASVCYIKRFEWPTGPRKLLNNLDLLEQCLALITIPNNPASLEKARKYYELTKLSISDLLDGNLKGKEFTLTQCATLVKLHYMGSENDPARYKELQNQLVRLKYLFEHTSEES